MFSLGQDCPQRRAGQQRLGPAGVQPRRLALGPEVSGSRLADVVGFLLFPGVVSDHRLSATAAGDQPVQR